MNVLCKGNEVNACGLGGLFKDHSKLEYDLDKYSLKASLKNEGIIQGFLDALSPFVNCW